MPVHPDYDRQVFINCPFDDAYAPLFRAIVFTIHAAGGKPRCALEVSDTSEVRLNRILRIIDECRLGVHDLSRTEPDADSGLPRFNMPLELGLFLACKHFGGNRHKRKSCLVLDREQYRYQQFISDIAGQDPQEHHDDVPTVIRRVRNWLRAATADARPGAEYFVSLYEAFLVELPQVCSDLHLSPDKLTYPDYAHVVTTWLTSEP